MVTLSNDVKRVVRRFYRESHCGYDGVLNVVWPVQAYLHERDYVNGEYEAWGDDDMSAIDRGDLDSPEGMKRFRDTRDDYTDQIIDDKRNGFYEYFDGLVDGLAFAVDGVLREDCSADWGETEAKTVRDVIDEAKARVSHYIDSEAMSERFKIIPMVDYPRVYECHSDGTKRRFDEAGTAWLDKWEHTFGIPDNGTVIGSAVVKGLQAAEDTDVFAMLAVRHLSIAMYTYRRMERWALRHYKDHTGTWDSPKRFWDGDSSKELHATWKRGWELFDNVRLLQYRTVSDMLGVMVSAYKYGKL